MIAARLFLGHQVYRKGGRTQRWDWATGSLWRAFRWSLGEINRSQGDGKSRVQGSRHVTAILIHGIDRLRPPSGSTTDGGPLRLSNYP